MGKLRNYFLNHYPRTDFHELNQDWMISMLYDMINQVENFVEMNSVKYADPIQWSITSQYEKNTIVVDAITGTAYISSKPVPMGVALSRTEYWSVIFDLGRFITLASQNFANSYEAVLTTTATMPTDKDKWVVWNSILYRAKNDIHVGDRYVIDGNIEKYTVEMFFDELAHLISEETEARIEADNALHGEIVDESVARENADTTLQDNIDTEATARANADTALQGNIDAEATAREDADTTLQDNIDTEATARANADTALQGNIDAEATAREDADTTLNTKINSLNRVYKDIDEMVADTSLSIGKCAVCLKPYESRWEITTATTSDLVNRTLANGLNAKLLNNVPINIAALKNYSNNDDISADVAFLIGNDYKNIIIPKGIYRCSVTVPSGTKICGMGITSTSLIPVGHGVCLSLDGDYIYLSDFSIAEVAPYTGYGIVVNQSLGCSNSHFENIHIENLKEGFFVRSTMIWCEFTNCDFIGCMDCGFIVTSPEAFFNNNSFYSCKFNNNVNQGIVIDVSEVHDYANVFYSCNIEYNAIDRFGVTHIATEAVKNTGFTSFIGCYFEGNGSLNTDATILNYDLLNLQGCVFVQDRILVNNTAPSITNFMGCKQYQCVGYTTSSSNVNTFGNNFTI